MVDPVTGKDIWRKRTAMILQNMGRNSQMFLLKISLEVDYINGNLESSTLLDLCHSNHSQTETIRNLRKCYGRKFRNIRLLSSVGRAALL